MTIDGPIAAGHASFFYREMMLAAQHAKYIIIHINSPGGDVNEAMAVHDYIRMISDEGVPCDTLAVGEVSSAACAIVVQAGDKRISFPNTRFMLHEIGRMLGGGGAERKSESEDVAKELKRVQDMIINLLCNRSNLTPKKFRTAIARKNLYMTATEALEWGLIDRIWTPSL